MSEVLEAYGYNDTPTKLVSQKTKEQQEQRGIDIHQYIKIEKNTEVNQLQDVEIQSNRDNINNIIQILEEGGIPISGGTINYDAGEWE